MSEIEIPTEIDTTARQNPDHVTNIVNGHWEASEGAVGRAGGLQFYWYEQIRKKDLEGVKNSQAGRSVYIQAVLICHVTEETEGAN